MVIRCFVCSNSSIRKSDSNSKEKPPLSFFGFPTDPSARLNWFDIFNLDPYENVKNFRVCSDHFCEEDIEVQSNGKKVVVRGAVPSKNLSQMRKSRYKLLKDRSKSQKTASNKLITIDKSSDNNFEVEDDCSEVITIVRSEDGDEGNLQLEESCRETESESDNKWMNSNDDNECKTESCRELHFEKDKQILILKERNRRLEKRIETLTNMLENFQS